MYHDRPQLSSREFRLLADLFRERAGLLFTESSLTAFERRLGERVMELNLGTFHEYYRYLRFAEVGKELETALSLVTTAETYFFRQEYQLRSFRNECLPELARQNQKHQRLTVWSAGCSTGEEVYTLAILIHQSGLFANWTVRVIGSDISGERVARARRGVYGDNAFRSTPASVRACYFTPHERQWRVNDDIKAMCHFAQLNLKSDSAAVSVGRVDVVFCRNVLIYFAPLARSEVIQNLYERLVPGGFLFLGHSESLLNVSTAFELVHFSDDLAYRKPRSSVVLGDTF